MGALAPLSETLFFFQAEDGIRDTSVTGVQTCALPIWPAEPIDLTPGPVGRTEDPVRLYLREMGRVALLTREGEIALAKRIEEGKNQVTAAILSTDLALTRFRQLREQPRRSDISVTEAVAAKAEEVTEEKG